MLLRYIFIKSLAFIFSFHYLHVLKDFKQKGQTWNIHGSYFTKACFDNNLFNLGFYMKLCINFNPDSFKTNSSFPNAAIVQTRNKLSICSDVQWSGLIYFSFR